MSTADGYDQGRLQERLGLALHAALRARDPAAMAALRSALTAIANAEAIGTDTLPAAGTSSQHVAGAAAGLGATEVPRRALTQAGIEAIVRTEIAERQHAAVQYAEAGHAERAVRLQNEARVLLAVLDPAG
jgi:uncharacterized protein YqeY